MVSRPRRLPLPSYRDGLGPVFSGSDSDEEELSRPFSSFPFAVFLSLLGADVGGVLFLVETGKGKGEACPVS